MVRQISWSVPHQPARSRTAPRLRPSPRKNVGNARVGVTGKNCRSAQGIPSFSATLYPYSVVGPL